MSKEKTAEKEQREQLTADRRALGSIKASMDEDAQRVREKARELCEAIERLNERYISACQRRDAIRAAGGADPGAPAPPIKLVGLIDFPALLEHPPRKRLNMRRTEEEKRAIEKRRREEWERGRFNELPKFDGLPSDIPFGGGL